MTKTDQVLILKKHMSYWRETNKYRSKCGVCQKVRSIIDKKIKQNWGIENVHRRERRFAILHYYKLPMNFTSKHYLHL